MGDNSRILIAEDEEFIVMLLEDMLVRRGLSRDVGDQFGRCAQHPGNGML